MNKCKIVKNLDEFYDLSHNLNIAFTQLKMVAIEMQIIAKEEKLEELGERMSKIIEFVDINKQRNHVDYLSA